MRKSLNRTYRHSYKRPLGQRTVVIESGVPVVDRTYFQRYIREESEFELDSDVMTDIIQSAQQRIKTWGNFCCSPERLRTTYEHIDRFAPIPFGPVTGIHSVKRQDANGETEELTEGNEYIVTNQNGLKRIEIVNRQFSVSFGFNTDFGLIVEYTAGYDPVGQEQQYIRPAVAKLAADLYMQRMGKQQSGMHTVTAEIKQMISPVSL